MSDGAVVAAPGVTARVPETETGGPPSAVGAPPWLNHAPSQPTPPFCPCRSSPADSRIRHKRLPRGRFPEVYRRQGRQQDEPG